MVDAAGGDPRGNGEVHPRVLEHPLRVIGFDLDGLRAEQRAVEAYRLGDAVDADMYMHAFHFRFSFTPQQLESSMMAEPLRASSRRLANSTVQHFSTMKRTSSVMKAKFAV